MDDGYNINSYILTTHCKHWWKYIEDNNWRIYIELFVTAKTDINSLDSLPIYTDVKLAIFNERVWEEINSNYV